MLRAPYYVQEHWTTVNGAKVRFLEAGGERPPLLLLPSSAGRCVEYREIISLLEDDFHCFAVDYPGFGLSDSAEGIEGSRDLARFVMAWADQIGLSQFHLAGFSLGGWVGVHLALAAPERILRLILIATSAGAIPGVPILSPVGMNKREILEHFYYRPEAREKMAREALSPDEKEEIRRSSQALVRLASHARLIPQFTNQLHEVHCPTLIIGGCEDKAIPPIYQETLHKGIPHSKIILFPETGHAVIAERPIETALEMRAFLASSS